MNDDDVNAVVLAVGVKVNSVSAIFGEIFFARHAKKNTIGH